MSLIGRSCAKLQEWLSSLCGFPAIVRNLTLMIEGSLTPDCNRGRICVAEARFWMVRAT